MLASAAEEDGHRGTVPAWAHWDPAGQHRAFPSSPSPSPFPAHIVLPQAAATGEGAAPQTQALDPQMCEGLAMGWTWSGRSIQLSPSLHRGKAVGWAGLQRGQLQKRAAVRGIRNLVIAKAGGDGSR